MASLVPSSYFMPHKAYHDMSLAYFFIHSFTYSFIIFIEHLLRWLALIHLLVTSEQTDQCLWFHGDYIGHNKYWEVISAIEKWRVEKSGELGRDGVMCILWFLIRESEFLSLSRCHLSRFLEAVRKWAVGILGGRAFQVEGTTMQRPWWEYAWCTEE